MLDVWSVIIVEKGCKMAKYKLTDLKKLQIAIEALKYFKRYSRDSRNYGMITTKVNETLEKIDG